MKEGLWKRNWDLLGLGAMGSRMVATLAKAGKSIVVFDIDSHAIGKALSFPGIIAASSPANLADQCRVLFTCLPNDAVVKEVYLGRDGIIQGAPNGPDYLRLFPR
jgi:3-hydroxyisobutyrate dehydrogenase-like beta-hydroxyacid dehydrogenase